MNEHAPGTMARADKGAMAAPPALEGRLAEVAEAVVRWPGVAASAHWHLHDRSRVDGIDFYLGEEELGHVHLDGSLHLATCQALGKALIGERLAQAFPYQRGWVCEDVHRIGSQAAIALFRRHYEQLRSVL